MMAKMHARRANRVTESDEDPPRRPPMPSSRGLSSGGSGGAGRGDPETPRARARASGYDESPMREPAAPLSARPDTAPRPMSQRSASGRRGYVSSGLEEDVGAAPPPCMPVPPQERPMSRDSRRYCADDLGGGRVRGPATARAARSNASHASPKKEVVDAKDEPLPPGVANADFGKLQEIIAQEIKNGEGSAAIFEEPAPLSDKDEELIRRREEMQNRREIEAQDREEARKKARLERQRAEELRRRQQAEELDREEQEQIMQREARKREEEQCYREHKAAAKIQAHVRGKRSRKGMHVQTPALSVKDLKPHQTPLSTRSTACSTPEQNLLD